MALIEKEILLEKVRNLYVQIASMETEEYSAPQPEMPKPEPELIPKRQYTPAKTMEEDVDLFFDTEHESYAVVEKELKELAEEINAAQDSQPANQEVVVEKPEVTLPETDIFDKIEKKEEPAPVADAPEKMEDDAKELFVEPDHAEDDILQFIPPKSAPAKPAAPVTPPPAKPEPKPEPERVKVVKPEPKPEPKPVQQPVQEVKPEPKPEQQPVQQPVSQPKQQRSLNDLFNEKREDHSISSQYQHAKVGDLTKAISINDKFIYIKELFHNRGEDFSASIRLLNECSNLEEAFDCLEQLKQKFFWDTKTDAYLSFCDLLRRKYS